MYDTILGNRVLYGAEARVFAGAAWSLTDQLRSFLPDPAEQSSNHLIGIPVLDSLTATQLIVLVDRVTEYLLDPHTAAPTRTALLDATIAAVFQQVAADVESEIDSESDSIEAQDTEARDDDTSIRNEVVAASEQSSDSHSSALDTPDPDCAVMDTWQFVIDSLCDRVLPDTDWQLESIAMDLDPDQGAELKGQMGIQDDYFIDVVPDASVEDAAAAWCDMIERISGWRPEKWRFGGGLPMPADADIPPKAGILSFSENDATHSRPGDGEPEFQQAKPVLLSDVMFEIEGFSEEWSSYVDRKNGTVVGVPSDAILSVEEGENPDKYFGNGSEECLELARKIVDSNDFVSLPDQFEIHEWSIMRDFCGRVKNESDREALLQSIHGNGAFRHFKSTIARLDLQDQWDSYRDGTIEQIVIDWLESNSIQWSRTKPGKPPF